MPSSRIAISSDRPPREHAAVGEHREAADHDQLVGDRVEERARARRAVAPREPAVEAVGGRDREPQADGEPRRPVAADQRERRDRDEDARDRDEVGRRRERALAEALRARAAAAAVARRRHRRLRLEVGARDAGDGRGDDRAGPGEHGVVVADEPHDAVDLGRFPVGAADEHAVVVGTVDEHVDGLAHERERGRAVVIGSCTSAHSRRRSRTSVVGDLAVHRRPRRCRLRARTRRSRPSRGARRRGTRAAAS